MRTTGTTSSTSIIGTRTSTIDAPPGTATLTRLDRLRGALPARNHNARTVAALAANPGCARRGVMDAAGIDKTILAERLGFPTRYGQSPFAIARGKAFEARVKADNGRELGLLLADALGTDPEVGAFADLAGENRPQRVLDREARVTRTRDALVRAARGDDGACAILDHPLLPLDVAGHRAFLEPDAMACHVAGRLYIVEIKSFAIIDGAADSSKLAAAARQAAVYVLALRRLARELGLGENLVATDIVLVCPKDFSNRPTAAVIDVRRQLATTRRRLERLAGIDELLAELPEGTTFDMVGERVGPAVAQVPAAYVPDCLTTCELADFCRHEARTRRVGEAEGGLVGLLGTQVRGALGGIDDIGTALRLADGIGEVQPDQEDVARLLRRAQALRGEALGRACGGDA